MTALEVCKSALRVYIAPRAHLHVDVKLEVMALGDHDWTLRFSRPGYGELELTIGWNDDLTEESLRTLLGTNYKYVSSVP